MILYKYTIPLNANAHSTFSRGSKADKTIAVAIASGSLGFTKTGKSVVISEKTEGPLLLKGKQIT